MDAKSDTPNSLEMAPKLSLVSSSKEDFQAGSTEKPSNLTGFKYWVKRLAVETGGIQRVTDEDRAENTSKWWNACTFWYVLLGLLEEIDVSDKCIG